MNNLIDSLQDALEQHWEAKANMEPSPTYEVIYEIGQELEEQGLGKVWLNTMSGRRAWLTLESMQFE